MTLWAARSSSMNLNASALSVSNSFNPVYCLYWRIHIHNNNIYPVIILLLFFFAQPSVSFECCVFLLFSPFHLLLYYLPPASFHACEALDRVPSTLWTLYASRLARPTVPLCRSLSSNFCFVPLSSFRWFNFNYQTFVSVNHLWMCWKSVSKCFLPLHRSDHRSSNKRSIEYTTLESWQWNWSVFHNINWETTVWHWLSSEPCSWVMRKNCLHWTYSRRPSCLACVKTAAWWHVDLCRMRRRRNEEK